RQDSRAGVIRSLTDLIKNLGPRYSSTPTGVPRWLFRGQTDASFQLIPSAGRGIVSFLGETLTKNHDLARFRAWLERAPFYDAAFRQTNGSASLLHSIMAFTRVFSIGRSIHWSPCSSPRWTQSSSIRRVTVSCTC